MRIEAHRGIIILMAGDIVGKHAKLIVEVVAGIEVIHICLLIKII